MPESKCWRFANGAHECCGGHTLGILFYSKRKCYEGDVGQS